MMLLELEEGKEGSTGPGVGEGGNSSGGPDALGCLQSED